MRPTALLIHGDARTLPLADASVQCVVTSPPYWGLRDYGVPASIWGGDPACAHAWGAAITKRAMPPRPDHSGSIMLGTYGEQPAAAGAALNVTAGAFCPCGAWRGVLGLEPTPERYVAHLVEIFREVRRVLRADGTCWVNLGDSYTAGGRGGHDGLAHLERWGRMVPPQGEGNSYMRPSLPAGLKPKDLIGIPWRVAFALQADGWWLRADVIWSKPNPMPESITDRPTKAHEYLFLLTKSARYYYDGEAIKEPSMDPEAIGGYHRSAASDSVGDADDQGYDGHRTRMGITRMKISGASYPSRNRRSVWNIATEPYPEAHFATFPEKLVEPCILAGTSERGACPRCGAPWGRMVERGEAERMGGNAGVTVAHADGPMSRGGHGQWDAGHMPTVRSTQTLGWSPACACPPADPVPCRVLDPFAGSGTVVAVAERLGRIGIGVELKPDYVTLARQRTVQAGLL